MKLKKIYWTMALAGNLTAFDAQAETITTGNELLAATQGNSAGNSVTLTLGQDVVLSENAGAFAGDITIDGQESKYAIDGQRHSGFISTNATDSLTVKNATLKNFGGSATKGVVINNDNGGTVNLQNVNFENNTLTGTYDGTTYAPTTALISNGNSGTMSIEGRFANNTNSSANDARANGALITNYSGQISKISGDFINNAVERTYTGGSYIHGGVIWQGGTNALIDQINGTFDDNIINSTRNSAYGSVVHVKTGTVNNISGSYTNNKAVSGSSFAAGGAIYNSNSIGSISGIFSNNEVKTDGTSTQSLASSAISSSGGAIHNQGSIVSIKDSSFENNKATGGAAKGGAIFSSEAGRSSGAIGEIVNSSFKNNVVTNTHTNTGDRYLAKGGAIYYESSDPSLTIKAQDGGVSEFSGNKTVQTDGSAVNNAIYMGKKNAVLNLTAQTDGQIIFNDEIDGINGYTINISGDETGRVALNNKVRNASQLTSENVTLALGISDDGSADLENVNLTMKSGVLDLENDTLQSVKTGIFSSTADVRLNIDADLDAGTSDRITASSVASGSEISLGSVNIINDGLQSVTVFANGEAPTFVNLADFAAFNQKYKYTFSDGGAGILDVASREQNVTGLNGAIVDQTENKSYAMQENDKISANLGKLEGSSLTIEGNNGTLFGEGYAGMEVGKEQSVIINNVEEISGFNSTEGGFIKNDGDIYLNNTSLKNNTADIGGAIYTTGNVHIAANGKDVVFEGNAAASSSNDNAIFVADKNAALNLSASNGKIHFKDGIDGVEGYKVNVDGTSNENGTVIFDKQINNLGELTVNTATVKLAEENLIQNADVVLNSGKLDLNNGKTGETNVANYTSNGGILSIDVDPAAGKADELRISGDASGHTQLLVHALDASKPEQNILFAKVDGNVNDASFDVWRVYGSPYDWGTVYDAERQEWYLNTVAHNPVLAAEMLGYIGLHSAGFELNRNLLRNVQNKVAANTLGYKCCGLYDENYDGKNLYNVWVSPTYSSLKVRNKADYDAEITGLEAGADVVSSSNSRTGFFLSYRQGDFDFSGRGDKLYAHTGTDMDIDSYAAGLYYNYIYRNWWLWSSVYGGYLDVNLRTGDGVKADTDGYMFGSRFAAGYSMIFAPGWTFSPIAALSYSFLHYDDFSDNAGKKVRYDDLSVVELELGARLEKQISVDGKYLKLYAQPGIVQNINLNNNVKISNFAKTHTTEDQLLGRMEIGARLSLTEQWMMFLNAEYMFGKGYSDTSVRAGVNYAW